MSTNSYGYVSPQAKKILSKLKKASYTPGSLAAMLSTSTSGVSACVTMLRDAGNIITCLRATSGRNKGLRQYRLVHQTS